MTNNQAVSPTIVSLDFTRSTIPTTATTERRRLDTRQHHPAVLHAERGKQYRWDVPIGLRDSGADAQCDAGRWSNNPTSYSYQWQDCTTTAGTNTDSGDNGRHE